ncbi:hypothetical protein [Streptomyces sp. NRRL S-118]|uniref:hypothetical protein n=1 Tax=Streptomyces sp. NRRL S-118 TaxID=1463881 RepID=UPI0004C7446B|nr:hypothetical protein [Streptomyces sp. NRRL S-118]
MRYAPGAVLNLVNAAKSYDAVVRTGGENGSGFYPVEAFAVILDRYDDNDQMVTHIEAVIRIEDKLLTVTDCKAAYGDDCILRYTN